jgi:mRNA interferase MazF
VIAQGDVCWAGSGPGFRRPVVVVQGDSLNRSRLATVVCVPLTSNVLWADAPGNVLLRSRATGLAKDSVANVSQIIALDRTLLSSRVGKTLAQTDGSRFCWNRCRPWPMSREEHWPRRHRSTEALLSRSFCQVLGAFAESLATSPSRSGALSGEDLGKSSSTGRKKRGVLTRTRDRSMPGTHSSRSPVERGAPTKLGVVERFAARRCPTQRGCTANRSTNFRARDSRQRGEGLRGSVSPWRSYS